MSNTKGLEATSFSLEVAENENEDREGVVYVTTSSSINTIQIIQRDGVVKINDTVFRSYCIDSFDANNDGLLSYKEARSVTRITIITDNIPSLDEFDNFVNLERLQCTGSGIGLGILKKLDVSKNTALKDLRCGGNQLPSLDVSKNTKLERLWCNHNQLTGLDVSKNIALKELLCYNTTMRDLFLTEGQMIENLDYNKGTTTIHYK